MESPKNSLQVQSLVKKVGSFEIHADFRIQNGERVALWGPSGSGKTTLLRVLAGLEAADSGSVVLAGRDVTSLRPEKRDIGVVFQDQALFPSLDVLGNATFGLRMRGVASEVRDQEGMKWLERVGLQALAHAPIEQLSGGERQRVAFVRAVIWKPKALLLDEPFSALDPSLRNSVRESLLEMHSHWPVPLLLVTHDEADSERIATRRTELRVEAGTAIRTLRDQVKAV